MTDLDRNSVDRMKILMIVKYPPIEGGVSTDSYWTAQLLSKMGHEVHVVTNSLEVEDEYRMELDKEDYENLHGFNRKYPVHFHSTEKDKKHRFIPQNNPYTSKLSGLALQICEEVDPDFIFAYYLQPYGVAALLVSQLTGVPFVVRHAGSDIGRLIKTNQLKPIYKQVMKQAAVVLSSRIGHFDNLRQKYQIKKDKIERPVALRFPSSIFYPDNIKVSKSKVKIGVYGKTGKSKGTKEIIGSMEILKEKGLPYTLFAHWGGSGMPYYNSIIDKKDLRDVIKVNSFIPHWEIPDFIRSCDLVLFLENNFFISFHGSGIPFEIVSCGRPVLTTPEIKNKEPYDRMLSIRKNCFIAEQPLTPESLAIEIEESIEHLQDKGEHEIDSVDTRELENRIKNKLNVLLEKISKKI